jgi:hypothetical protein
VKLVAALGSAAILAGCGGGGASDGCEDLLLAGDLVITEVFADADAPSGGSGVDEGREWFEVYNAAARTLDLTGLELRHSRGDGSMVHVFRLDPVSIPAGEYLVFGNVLDDLKPAHVDVGYENRLGDLYNTGEGRLSLHCGDTEIDRAPYADVAPGVSRALDGGAPPDYTTNDDLGRWCEASAAATEFEPANFGTPGAANEDCEQIVPGMCDDGGTLRATVPPVPGDLVITEVMPSPALAPDTTGEWFEVRVGRDVDLNGVGLDRAGDSAEPDVLAAEACLAVATGELLVFARSTDVALNGGLPRVDGTFTFAMITGGAATPGDVALTVDGTVIDAVTWTGSQSGASRQVDPDFANAPGNDDELVWCDGTTPYGAGDLGTPGADNAQCDIPPPPGMCDDNGSLRPIVAPAAGDLVITEVMPDPSAVPDTAGEWFEVVALASVDLNGLGLDRAGDTAAPEVIDQAACLPLAQGDFAVFARDADPALNGGLPFVTTTFSFALVAGSVASPGDVQLVAGDGVAVLDAVTWTASTAGASIQLDPDQTSPAANDDPANLCPGTAPYGLGDLGSPGAANQDCPLVVPPGSCFDPIAMVVRPIVVPVAGDLELTEWMPNPSLVLDGNGEWLELRAVNPVDLNGLQLGDDLLAATPVIATTDCVPITAGAYLVFAQTTDPATNGMLPVVAAAFPSGVDLVNGAGTVQLGVGGVAIATRTWTASAAGVSIQTDADGTQCDAPTGTATYNGTDVGTPGAVHGLECP